MEWPVGPLGRSLSGTMMKKCLRVIDRPTHQSSVPKLERKAGGIGGWEMILIVLLQGLTLRLAIVEKNRPCD